jgi:hypothetical protein
MRRSSALVARSPTRVVPAAGPPPARMRGVNLGRISWLATVVVCLVVALTLAIRGDYGYSAVTLAVAIAAAINLF